MANELRNWQDLPIGGLIIDAGNAAEYDTGDWRAFRPVFNAEGCTHCMFCWLYCPDASVIVEDGRMVGIDYKHCKGCGICAEVCPSECISMHLESEFLEEAAK
jgi:pyruvate ferredoxin oxidoreductase delta subunit